MGHKCTGEWRTWSRDELEAVKIADPENYRGVTKVQDKICEVCGNLLGEKREY